jgi:hypothetical protein
MPALGVNLGAGKNSSKYKDLHAETCGFLLVESTFRVGKSATGHNVAGISAHAQ